MADARDATERAEVIVGMGANGSRHKRLDAKSLKDMAHHVQVIKTVDTDVRPG